MALYIVSAGGLAGILKEGLGQRARAQGVTLPGLGNAGFRARAWRVGLEA